MVKSSRIFGATMSVNAAGSEYSTRDSCYVSIALMER